MSVPKEFDDELTKNRAVFNHLQHEKIETALRPIMRNLKEKQGSVAYLASGDDLEYLLAFPASKIIGIDSRYGAGENALEETSGEINKTLETKRKLESLIEKVYLTTENILEQKHLKDGYHFKINHPNGFSQEIHLLKGDITNEKEIYSLLENHAPYKLIFLKGLSGEYQLNHLSDLVDENGHVLESDKNIDKNIMSENIFESKNLDCYMPVRFHFDKRDSEDNNYFTSTRIHTKK